MKKEFVEVNEVPTLVITYGKSIHEKFTDEKEIILFMVGNPGVPGFFAGFLQQLYNNFDGKIPVWGIGAAGHNYPNDSKMIVPALESNENKYNLQGQIDHKLDFIRRYIPDHVKIYIVGHSLGSLLTLRLLEHEDIKNRFGHCYLLFPVIERMDLTPRAPAFKQLYINNYNFLKFVFTFFYIFPYFIRKLAVTIYYFVLSISLEHATSVVDYINPYLLEKSVFLTKEIMQNIKMVDYSFIEKHKNMLTFYYGSRDGWSPVEYYNDLKKNVPDVDANLDNYKMPHTFVFQKNNKMAEILTSWIKVKQSINSY